MGKAPIGSSPGVRAESNADRGFFQIGASWAGLRPTHVESAGGEVRKCTLPIALYTGFLHHSKVSIP